MPNNDQPTRRPKLSEMRAEGMGITEALAFWNEIANDPDRPVEQCWADLRERVRARRESERGSLQ